VGVANLGARFHFIPLSIEANTTKSQQKENTQKMRKSCEGTDFRRLHIIIIIITTTTIIRSYYLPVAIPRHDMSIESIVADIGHATFKPTGMDLVFTRIEIESDDMLGIPMLLPIELLGDVTPETWRSEE